MKFKKFIYPLLLSLLVLTGCEDTNVVILTEAGKDAVSAITLSENQVKQLAVKTADYSDSKNQLALLESRYARRLSRLVKGHNKEGENNFNYRVYVSDKVNAFALADGSIRVYSGLMNMMTDSELRFVLGHEMGHVIRNHSEKQMRLALAGSAIRKGLASQENIMGDLARSGLIGGLLERLVNAQFSQAEEMEADEYALSFLKRHNYDPAGAVSALEKLAGSGRKTSLLSSHPEAQERVANISELIKNPDNEPNPGLLESFFDMVAELFSHLKAFFGKMINP